MNEVADDVVIRDNELLGEHIPVRSADMVTLGELLTVQEWSQDGQTSPTKEKLQLINDTICTQKHLSHQQ